MKFKEARTRRRGWKGRSLTQYTHAPVFEPLFFSLPSSSLEIYISSLLAGTVCLSRFLLKSRWWLYPNLLNPPWTPSSSSSSAPRNFISISFPLTSFRMVSLFPSFFHRRTTENRRSLAVPEPAAPHLPLYRDNPPFTARLRFVGR